MHNAKKHLAYAWHLELMVPLLPCQWGVPSWVVPGTVAENAFFLQDKVPAISLCCFESKACLLDDDLDYIPFFPGIQWHLHMPLDLPWELGGKTVAQICLQLYKKVAYLNPVSIVFHPPGIDTRAKLENLRLYWNLPIALENTPQCDLANLGEEFLAEHSFDICLDVAHAMAFEQEDLLNSPLPEKASIWHWSAPGQGDRHLSLSAFSPGQYSMAKELWNRAKPAAWHILEIFHWPDICKSLPVLANFSSGEKQYDFWC